MTIDAVTLFHPIYNASITILVCQIISGPVPTPVLRTCDRHRRQRRRGCSGRDPQIFDLQGSSCVDDPPIIWQVFYFFPFNGTWHMNLKNNTPRMHHITPFSDEKFIHKFSGKGHSLDSPRFSHLRRSACDQWCIGGGYTRVYAVYQPPGFLTAYTHLSDHK